MSSLLANLSSLSTGGEALVDPADAMRNAMIVSAVLEYASEPESDNELAEVLELKVPQCRLSVSDVANSQGLGITRTTRNCVDSTQYALLFILIGYSATEQLEYIAHKDARCPLAGESDERSSTIPSRSPSNSFQRSNGTHARYCSADSNVDPNHPGALPLMPSSARKPS